MGTTNFSGPITVGDIKDTSGTTVGSDVKNTGIVVAQQSYVLTQAGSATADATDIVLPANSHILAIDVYVTAGWSGGSSLISIGTSGTSTELVVGGDLTAVGKATLSPGTDATRTANWIDVGTNDVQIYALSANTGTGAGVLTVTYAQAADLTP